MSGKENRTEMIQNITITEEEFGIYEGIRSSGKYNMITEMEDVIKKIGMNMTEERYFLILSNYDILKEKYGVK